MVKPYSQGNHEYSWLSNWGPLSVVSSSGIPWQANGRFIALITEIAELLPLRARVKFYVITVMVDHYAAVGPLVCIIYFIQHLFSYNTSSRNDEGTIPWWERYATPSYTEISSLKLQYWLRCSGVSFLSAGHPGATLSHRAARTRSLAVSCLNHRMVSDVSLFLLNIHLSYFHPEHFVFLLSIGCWRLISDRWPRQSVGNVKFLSFLVANWKLIFL